MVTCPVRLVPEPDPLAALDLPVPAVAHAVAVDPRVDRHADVDAPSRLQATRGAIPVEVLEGGARLGPVLLSAAGHENGGPNREPPVTHRRGLVEPFGSRQASFLLRPPLAGNANDTAVAVG